FVLPVKLRLRPLLGAHSGAPAAQASPPEMRWRLLYALFSQLVLELAAHVAILPIVPVCSILACRFTGIRIGRAKKIIRRHDE
ncbi:MAG: hypothetical protein U0N52_07850, partial [Muribaculaceae bacterium]